jgi:hypothetical protein
LKTPDWSEIAAFCQIDGWDEVDQGRSADHRYYRRVFDDGTVLETRVSHAAKKTMSPGRWKAILRDQLQVSEQAFWDSLRRKEPSAAAERAARRGGDRGVPAGAAVVLSSRLRMSPAAIAALGRERAIQLAHEAWSKNQQADQDGTAAGTPLCGPDPGGRLMGLGSDELNRFPCVGSR